MDREYNTEEFQFQQMREELKQLQESLQKQKIFTDKSMRRVMAQRSSWIDTMIKGEILFIPLFIIIMIGINEFMGMSWTFFIFSILFFITDVIWDMRINRLKADDYAFMSLIELKTRLLHQKEMRHKQIVIEVPLVIVWGAWFAYDLTTNAKGIYQDVNPWIMIILISILSILGLLVAFLIYNKMQSTDSEALNEIEKMKSEI